MNYNIHWFRRDLRVAGNPALRHSLKNSNGNTVGIFCFDKKFLSRHDFSYIRFQFFLVTLKKLKEELNAIGSDLLVLDHSPVDAFNELFQIIKKNNLQMPNTISWNRDYEPFAVLRDIKMNDLFRKEAVSVHTERDHLILEPDELYKKNSNEGYVVFTPFSRNWLDKFQTDLIKKRISTQRDGIEYLNKITKNNYPKIFKLKWEDILKNKYVFPDHLQNYIESNSKNTHIAIPPSGSIEAFKALKIFKKKICSYKSDRDIPSIEASSELAPYLKNGTITTAQIIYYLKLSYYSKGSQEGEDVFFSQIIWREFYYHFIYRNPRVEKEAYILKYKNLKWINNKKQFELWKNGKTGFPIVDAGMRQLLHTGYMHNRLRMIVASFLVKDLLIDWRWGEKYFMECLYDGDLAANNGGWQWAASTGCDAQPYFRIFNPWLQSRKFDPNGIYIKKYIPELQNVEAKKLHSPILDHEIYPSPIVEHSNQRELALAVYKSKQ
jgi:deoxyribodipyrimidine photo-lyase